MRIPRRVIIPRVIRMVSGTWCVLLKYGSGENDGDDDEEEDV